MYGTEPLRKWSPVEFLLDKVKLKPWRGPEGASERADKVLLLGSVPVTLLGLSRWRGWLRPCLGSLCARRAQMRPPPHPTADLDFWTFSDPHPVGQELAGEHRAYITGQESDTSGPVIRAMFTRKRCF